MKKTESNNLAEKKPTIVKLKENAGNSSKNRNQNPDLEKTLETKKFLEEEEKKLSKLYDETIKSQEKTRLASEEAQIEEKNYSEQMDEIIKNNDKFETISVLISVLCRELGIQVTNQPGVIGQAIKKVYDDYYKSMEDWKNLTKMGVKNDIRQ